MNLNIKFACDEWNEEKRVIHQINGENTCIEYFPGYE